MLHGVCEIAKYLSEHHIRIKYRIQGSSLWTCDDINIRLPNSDVFVCQYSCVKLVKSTTSHVQNASTYKNNFVTKFVKMHVFRAVGLPEFLNTCLDKERRYTLMGSASNWFQPMHLMGQDILVHST